MGTNSICVRRAFRLGFAVVIIEGAAYFLEMIIVASRLHGGAGTGTAHAVGRIFGLTAFSAVRHGYHSQVSSATWVVPAMIALPLAVGVIGYFLPTQRDGIRRHAYGSGIDS